MRTKGGKPGFRDNVRLGGRSGRSGNYLKTSFKHPQNFFETPSKLP